MITNGVPTIPCNKKALLSSPKCSFSARIWCNSISFSFRPFVSLCVTGLILLDKRQTSRRISFWLPARSHDALNRLLRSIPISTRALMGRLILLANRLNMKGYLVIDDVVVEKPFSKKIPWVAWTYSTTKRQKVLGLHIVVLLWCSGSWRIPVAFRIWCPRDRCRPGSYKTKAQLA